MVQTAISGERRCARCFVHARAHAPEEMTDYVVTRWYRAPELMLLAAGLGYFEARCAIWIEAGGRVADRTSLCCWACDSFSLAKARKTAKPKAANVLCHLLFSKIDDFQHP